MKNRLWRKLKKNLRKSCPLFDNPRPHGECWNKCSSREIRKSKGSEKRERERKEERKKERKREREKERKREEGKMNSNSH